MRLLARGAAMLSALVGMTSAANAALVTELVSTIISEGSIDTQGLFGPKGADLSGKRMNIRFQYQTDDFNSPPENCYAYPLVRSAHPESAVKKLSVTQYECTLYTSVGKPNGFGNPALTQSFLIAVDVDGVFAAFVPAGKGQMLVTNAASPPSIQILLDGDQLLDILLAVLN